MAGTIFISGEADVSMSGPMFVHVVEAIRSCLVERAPEIASSVYAPHDLGAMDFITLEGLSREQFTRFHEAVVAADAKDRLEAPSASVRQTWGDLLAGLEADPRLEPIEPG